MKYYILHLYSPLIHNYKCVYTLNCSILIFSLYLCVIIEIYLLPMNSYY